MQRIATATKATDLFGAGKHGFKDGDLSQGITPTDLNAAWFNAVQEELLSVIEAAGLVPGAINSQVFAALQTGLLSFVKEESAATRYRSATVATCAALVEV